MFFKIKALWASYGEKIGTQLFCYYTQYNGALDKNCSMEDKTRALSGVFMIQKTFHRIN